MSYVIDSFPIAERLLAAGKTLDPNAVNWMQKWKGMDLENETLFQCTELSGSTSINLKIRTVGADSKSRGTFVPKNLAGNPNSEIGYFNLAAILGYSHLIRPAARYELGAIASAKFKYLMDTTPIAGAARLQNKRMITEAIKSGKPLPGCVKAKKPDSAISLEAIRDSTISPNGGPKASHDVVKAIQASQPMPVVGESFTLKTGYVGDAFALGRELSIVMTLDAIFEQWDRFSGGNSGIDLDDQKNAHFYMTDNGGAGPAGGNGAKSNLKWFTRFDRKVLDELVKIASFLDGQGTYLEYANAENFVIDLGLYFDAPARKYVDRLKRNITLVLAAAQASEKANGVLAYFE